MSAVTIGTSNISKAVNSSFQRKVIFAAGLFWAFFADAGSVRYRTSSDGLTWSSATVLRAGSNEGINVDDRPVIVDEKTQDLN